MSQLLMPMATAVWLVDSTGLTFRQIGKFCGLHELEVQAVADGTVAQNMVGQDPTVSGQLSWEEIHRCEGDASQALVLIEDDVPPKPRTAGPRYTPLSKRQDKPDAISWLVRNHAEISDAQLCRLIGTTKPTINAIRDRTHWNSDNILSRDPVGLGLCSQKELDAAVEKAAKRAGGGKKAVEAEARVVTLVPKPKLDLKPKGPTIEEKLAAEAAAARAAPAKVEKELSIEDVFGPAKKN